MSAAPFVQPCLCAHARLATDADLGVIRAWLQQQDLDEVHGTFLCNWRLTEKQHAAGALLVYVDEQLDEPVAYQWGGLLEPGILEVRNDMRGRGIGKALVAHRLAQAAAAGEDILYIQCKPSTSIPFWKSMGFELLEATRDGTYAFRLMHRPAELPDDGVPVEVSIEWFPEDRKWALETPALRSQAMKGVLLEGKLYLAERALCHNKLYAKDIVLRVIVNDVEWYLGKAKHAESDCLGVERCVNGFYLDSFYRPEDDLE